MKKLISYIIAFLLMICIIILLIISIFKYTILNKKYVLNVLDKNNYYQIIDKEIKGNIENYYYQSGIEHYVIEDLYSLDKVKIDLLEIINYIYEDKEIFIEVESIQKKLQKNFNKMLEENDLYINQKNIDKYIELISAQYSNGISLDNSIINVLNKVVTISNEYITRYYTVLILITIILVITLFIINIKEKRKSINYLGISLVATGIFLVVLNFIIHKIIDIKNIYILSNAISEVTKVLLNNILIYINVGGIMLLVIGIAFGCFCRPSKVQVN